MKIADGVYVHFIPTQKYKTNRIVFRIQPIRRIQQYSLLKRD